MNKKQSYSCEKCRSKILLHIEGRLQMDARVYEDGYDITEDVLESPDIVPIVTEALELHTGGEPQGISSYSYWLCPICGTFYYSSEDDEYSHGGKLQDQRSILKIPTEIFV